MQPEVAKLLYDARAACVAIATFTLGKDFSTYAADAMLRSAVERQFEIIGEALGRAVRIEPGLEAKIPEIHRIVGLRNRLIHGYDSVVRRADVGFVADETPGVGQVVGCCAGGHRLMVKRCSLA